MFWTIAFMFVTLKAHLKIVNMDTMEQIADKFVVIVQEHCDRVSGVCENGCMPGYYSALWKLPTYLPSMTYHSWSNFCSNSYLISSRMFWTIAFMFVTLKVLLKIVNMDPMEQIADNLW